MGAVGRVGFTVVDGGCFLFVAAVGVSLSGFVVVTIGFVAVVLLT